jgi:pilus assembly protein Flp/PilA
MEKMIKFFKDEEGVTAIEYALIAFLIAVFIIGAVTLAGERIRDTFQAIAGALGGGTGG